MHYDVPRPSDQRPTLPPALDDLVLRATMRDPAGRPADAAAFLAETVAVRRALRPEVLDDLAGSGMPAPAPAPAHGSPTLAFGHVPPGAAAGPHAATEQISRVPTGAVKVPAGNPPAGKRGPGAGRPSPNPGVPYPVPARLQHRRRRGLLALLAVLITTFAVGIGAWQVAVGSSVDTPGLIGLTEDQARAKATEAGLKFRVVGQEFDEIYPAGQVLSTDPAPGRNISSSGTITAVVSKGPERYTVPDLENVEVDEAKRRLTEEASLTVNDQVTEKYSDTIAEGKVIRTEPAAGTSARKDQAVTLIVSKGAKPQQLPDVVGKLIDEATALLKDAGFEVSVTEQENNEVANGTVLEQTPTGNRKIAKGSTIDLVVAKSDLVEVPRVIGMDVDDAEDLLRSLGFEVDRAGFPFGDRVVDQDPEPGTRLPRGSTVTLRVF